jgi:NAD(P)-dependent dehydrogenase (short-subunit alcohol dehydrogenase family)
MPGVGAVTLFLARFFYCMTEKSMSTIFITGTSSGLGNALAKEYLRKGARVWGLSRRAPADLQSKSSYIHLSCDLADHAQVAAKVSQLLEDTPVLDLMILNAAILPDISDMKDTPLESIKKVMHINVWANKLLIDLVMDRIKVVKQIVAVSSGASVSGSRGWNAYSVSKAGLNMMISLYAKEMPDTHFSAIAPGVVDTEMQETIASLPDDPRFSTQKKLRRMRKAGEMFTPEEASRLMLLVIGLAKDEDSGSYLDVRDYT